MKVVQSIKSRAKRSARNAVCEGEGCEQGRVFRDVSLESSTRRSLVVVDKERRNSNARGIPANDIVIAIERKAAALSDLVFGSQRNIVAIKGVANDIDLARRIIFARVKRRAYEVVAQRQPEIGGEIKTRIEIEYLPVCPFAVRESAQSRLISKPHGARRARQFKLQSRVESEDAHAPAYRR